jgi:glycosyltransferase involved in cell wall biosynthesis
LAGAVSNIELMNQYRNNDFHIFINVSESEGVPVSIMEATSFGIPVIATDVGGVNEVVRNGENGFLMDENYTDDALIGYIRKFAEMDEYEYMKFRKNARGLWYENYNAEFNYKEFNHLLISGK